MEAGLGLYGADPDQAQKWIDRIIALLLVGLSQPAV